MIMKGDQAPANDSAQGWQSPSPQEAGGPGREAAFVCSSGESPGNSSEPSSVETPRVAKVIPIHWGNRSERFQQWGAAFSTVP